MVTLRPARRDDWARLFAWRRDPLVMANFFAPAPGLAEHVAWLSRALADPHLRAFIAQVDGVPVGTGRLAANVATRTVDLSIALAPEARGRRLAGPLVRTLLVELDAWSKVRGWPAVAVIKPQNLASMRAFASCGFAPLLPPECPDRVTLVRQVEPSLVGPGEDLYARHQHAGPPPARMVGAIDWKGFEP